jgi:hypothetical protein
VELARNTTPNAAQAQPQPQTELSAVTPQIAIGRLEELSLVKFPDSFGAWANYWSREKFLMQMFGILLTSILLSLGAPFWYGALTNLLRLRGVLAVKEEKDRTVRQTAQSDSTAPAAGNALG